MKVVINSPQTPYKSYIFHRHFILKEDMDDIRSQSIQLYQGDLLLINLVDAVGIFLAKIKI